MSAEYKCQHVLLPRSKCPTKIDARACPGVFREDGKHPGWQLGCHRGSSSQTLSLQRCLRIRDHPSKNLQDLVSLDNSPIHQDPWKALRRELLTGGYRRQKQHAAVHLTSCRRPPRYSTTPLQQKDKSWTSWWKVHAVMFREKHHIPQSSTAECQAGKKLNHHQ